jgi:EpsI family protein
MSLWLKNFILLALMLAASGLALALRPTHKIAYQGPRINLESMIPKHFGDWSIDEKVVYQQVSPEVKAALGKIYNQVLTRTYINNHGYQIMLSIPYGMDQSDDLSAHDPEGCYPAQGFQIMSKNKEILHTSMGDIPVRRMEALSGNRHELVTYWFTVGNLAVNNDWERKKAQMRHALIGEIPDGMLVRVSSVDADTQEAYRIQGAFIEGLIKALPLVSRTRVSGVTY